MRKHTPEQTHVLKRLLDAFNNDEPFLLATKSGDDITVSSSADNHLIAFHIGMQEIVDKAKLKIEEVNHGHH